MKWKQRAKLKLSIDPVHLKNWSKEREVEIIKLIHREFCIDASTSEVTFYIKNAQRLILEFTVALSSSNPRASEVVKAMERHFFGLKIYSRVFSFEEK